MSDTESAPAEAPTPQVHAEPAASSTPPWPTIKVPLVRPLAGAPLISVIELREPDLEALEKIEEAGIAFDPNKPDQPLTIKQIRMIVSALSGIDPERLKRLAVKDVAALSEALSPLLSGLST